MIEFSVPFRSLFAAIYYFWEPFAYFVRFPSRNRSKKSKYFNIPRTLAIIGKSFYESNSCSGLFIRKKWIGVSYEHKEEIKGKFLIL